MPASLHHDPPAGSQLVADARGGGRAQRIFAAAGLLVQEVRTPQADADFGMAAQPDQLGFLIGRAAAPARQRLCGIRLGACGSSRHDNFSLLPA